jgi:tetratricopeptide (TPR) repeat protein
MRARLVRRLWPAAVLFCGLSTAASPSQPAAQITLPPSTQAIVLRYAAGEYDVFKTLAPLQALVLLSNRRSIPDPGFGGERSRRVLAAFGLELARSARLDQWHEALNLIASVRAELIMRPLRRDGFDRHWHEAVIGTLEMIGDVAALDLELNDALKEFPGEPRFVLARAVSEELRLQALLPAGARLGDFREAELVRLRSTLQSALALPAVRGEAALRLGRLELALGRHSEALQRFDEAEPRVDEPALQYLVRLSRGEALAALGRADEAKTAYRSALEVGPDVQSATLKLAGLLFVEGRREEADALVDHLIGLPAAEWDPWWTYRNGDQRLLSQALGELRQDCR